MTTVPIALAIVASQLIHRSAVRQSRGPSFVALYALMPPKMALMMLPLNMNFRNCRSFGLLSTLPGAPSAWDAS
jgi:F0F1-type ATP synthase membrane subunit a